MLKRSEVAVVVIGGGVVGCAIGYELSLLGFCPLILEAGPRVGEGVTSRNSGVIHAGIYYPPQSLKAQSCIRGKELLYEWCMKYEVPYRKVGKWIVGASSDESDLSDLYENARRSGATGLSFATQKHISEKLRGVKAEVAIYSEETGIVDPYEYTKSFLFAAEEKGAQCLTHTQVTAIEKNNSGGFLIQTSRGEVNAELVINAAGLYADEIAKMVGITQYQVYPWRGNYFKLTTSQKYEYLIYPVKKKKAPGLGIHLTLSLDGTYRLGPDVEFVKHKNEYSDPIDLEKKRKDFFESVSRYLEGIQLDGLAYDTCGIRPKLRSPQDSEDKDFIISADLPGFINLVGIESPGLTASRDLAQRVTRLCVQ